MYMYMLFCITLTAMSLLNLLQDSPCFTGVLMVCQYSTLCFCFSLRPDYELELNLVPMNVAFREMQDRLEQLTDRLFLGETVKALLYRN